MQHLAPTVVAACTAAGPVVGRIEGSPGELAGTLARWREHLTAIGFAAGSITTFVGTVEQAARENGWGSLQDLAHPAVPEWMHAKRTSGQWKSTTYNRAISAFRALSEFVGMPLVAGAKRSRTTDAGEGARAATDDEARAMIRYAHYRRASDKRALSARDVYYAALFYTGGRYCEPATWQWAKHVFLEPEKPGDPAFVPHLLYEAKHHKAARTEEVPIHPELAAILRHHRTWLRTQPEEAIDRLCPHSGQRIEARVNPDHPEAYVFPRIPPPHVWRTDRDAIGVPGTDRKGRKFCWHSCRDWFVTRLIEAGVQSTIVRKLARHAPDPHEGYYNGNLATLHEKISLLPSLWPVRLYDSPGTADKQILEKSSGLLGASSRNIDRLGNLQQRITNLELPEPDPLPSRKGEGTRRSACPSRGASLTAPMGSPQISSLGTGVPILEKTVDSKALALALASAAEALRLAALELAGESCDGDQRTT